MALIPGGSAGGRGLQELADLENRRLVLEVGGQGRIPGMWLETALLRAGLRPGAAFFAEVQEAKKASQTVLPVFFGQADAALVRQGAFETLAELNPQLEQELTPLAVSPRLLPGLICFPAGTDPEKKQAVREGALALHPYPRGRQILTLFRVDRVALFKPEFLEPVMTLIAEKEALEARSGGER